MLLHLPQTVVDERGRPTLLLIRDTTDQAIQDTTAMIEDLEDLLTFLQNPDSLTPNAAVAQKLTDWGPGLAALNPTLNPGAHPPDGPAASHNSNSLALVLAGDAAMNGTPSRAAAAAAGSGFGGLDPAAARRLARQCAARGATTVLQQLGKQLHLLEQCLAIVLLHFIQVGATQKG